MARLASHLVDLPEQFCCFFLFISSFNWLTSAKSFSTDRSLTSTVMHIFCKEKSMLIRLIVFTVADFKIVEKSMKVLMVKLDIE